MKRSMCRAAVVAASVVGGQALAEPMQVALLQEAILSGKTTMELRLRGEYVDFETTPETDAQTLRTVLGYRTGDYQGVNAFVEFENVSTLGNGEYNSGTTGAGNRQTQYGLIPDPALTQLNQAYLDGYGVRFGRQKIIYDNARFIGDVGWRQNDQVFDAVSVGSSKLADGLTLNAAYLKRVHNIFGASRRVEAPLLNLRYAAYAPARVSAFYYAVDEEDAPATSWQHVGARLDGKAAGLLYELAYAEQSDYADATAAGTPEASYYDAQLGYTFGPVTLKAQYEVLEQGFRTPLATLHAFNGWADRFLTTPAAGLEDTALWLTANVAGFGLVLAAHDFQAEASAAEYGRELDVSVSRALTGKLTGLLKAAYFDADGSVAGFSNDTTKVWLQLHYKM